MIVFVHSLYKCMGLFDSSGISNGKLVAMGIVKKIREFC